MGENLEQNIKILKEQRRKAMEAHNKEMKLE